MSNSLERLFPNLAQSGYKLTSPPTPEYNCIAWAAEDSKRWWWPDAFSYWPPDVPLEETIQAFIEAYDKLGYVICKNDGLEDGYEKIAVYAKDGIPQHAARQLPSGAWTSKLGSSVDIEHNSLDAVNGIDYGSVAVILKRKK